MDDYKKELNSFRKDKLVELCKSKGLNFNVKREILIEQLLSDFEKEISDSIVDEIMNNSLSGDESNSSMITVVANSNSSRSDLRKENDELRNIAIDFEKKFKLMEREIAVLEKEKELLNRELKLNKNSATSSNSESDHCLRNFKFIDNLLYDYSPESGTTEFAAWLANIKTVKSKYGIDDDIMKIIMLGKIKGKALRWFHSNPDHLQLDYDELIRRMEIMFGCRSRRLEMRQKFENRLWQPGESFADYYHEKIILSGGLDFTDDELIDFMIDGVNDTTLSNQIKMQQFDTPEEMLSSCGRIIKKKVVNNLPNASDRHKKNSYVNSSLQNGRPNASSSNGEQTRPITRLPNQQPIVKCFNCGLPGHYIKDCKRESREKGSCYECGEMGHFFFNCPKKIKSSK